MRRDQADIAIVIVLTLCHGGAENCVSSISAGSRCGVHSAVVSTLGLKLRDPCIFKSTKMKLRPYFTMELVQKLMKKT